MTYYSGYPETVEIGIHGMSIDDVEHLILTLSGEDKIHPINRIMLWDNYTKARAQYWDAQFDIGEEERKCLNELGQKIIVQIEEMYALRNRLLKQELEKREKGKKAAKRIELETAIQDWYSEDATDMEVDFYSGLFDFQPRHGISIICANVMRPPRMKNKNTRITGKRNTPNWQKMVSCKSYTR